MGHHDTGHEYFVSGEPVPASGEYCAVDEEGVLMDIDPLRLEQGDTFPQLASQRRRFVLNPALERLNPQD